MKSVLMAAMAVVLVAAVESPAQAGEDWFIAGVFSEPYVSAPLVIVTRRIPNHQLTIDGSHPDVLDWPATFFMSTHVSE